MSHADTQLPDTIAPSITSVGVIIVDNVFFASTPYTYVSCNNPCDCNICTYATLGSPGNFSAPSIIPYVSNTSVESGVNSRANSPRYTATLNPANLTAGS